MEKKNAKPNFIRKPTIFRLIKVTRRNIKEQVIALNLGILTYCECVAANVNFYYY